MCTFFRKKKKDGKNRSQNVSVVLSSQRLYFEMNVRDEERSAFFYFSFYFWRAKKKKKMDRESWLQSSGSLKALL